jgi:hypothetical protein
VHAPAPAPWRWQEAQAFLLGELDNCPYTAKKHHLINLEVPRRHGELDAVRPVSPNFEMMREDEDFPVDTSNGSLCKE